MFLSTLETTVYTSRNQTTPINKSLEPHITHQSNFFLHIMLTLNTLNLDQTFWPWSFLSATVGTMRGQAVFIFQFHRKETVKMETRAQQYFIIHSHRVDHASFAISEQQFQHLTNVTHFFAGIAFNYFT